ncbi:MAG: hypothetical protein Q8755_02980, partial [Candidatus Phytoplasma australasiaticum]|nr:hypothetical protein [Candidatus Phytoplasma australasiaticum]
MLRLSRCQSVEIVIYYIFTLFMHLFDPGIFELLKKSVLIFLKQSSKVVFRKEKQKKYLLQRHYITQNIRQ